MTVFSQNLKRFRIAKNMTQEQAAEVLGVSTQTVSRWECNRTSLDNAYKMLSPLYKGQLIKAETVVPSKEMN